MIVEEKKLTAFDAMEAAMRLSDMYKANRSKKSVSFSFGGAAEVIEFQFYEWENFEITNDFSFRIYLDAMTGKDSFSDVFLKIEEEMDEMAKIEKEKKDEIQSA